MAFAELMLAVGGALVGAGGLLYRSMRDSRHRRAVRRRLVASAPAPIGSVTGPRWVVLEGLASARETLTAPLSGREAIGVRLKVAGQRLGGAPVTLDLAWIAPFELVDDTGRAWVDPGQQAHALFVPADEGRVLDLDELMELRGFEELVQILGVDLRSLIGCDRIWVCEHLLPPDGTALVAGHADLQADPGDDAMGAFRGSGWQVHVRPHAGHGVIVANLGRRALSRSKVVFKDLPPGMGQLTTGP